MIFCWFSPFFWLVQPIFASQYEGTRVDHAVLNPRFPAAKTQHLGRLEQSRRVDLWGKNLRLQLANGIEAAEPIEKTRFQPVPLALTVRDASFQSISYAETQCWLRQWPANMVFWVWVKISDPRILWKAPTFAQFDNICCLGHLQILHGSLATKLGSSQAPGTTTMRWPMSPPGSCLGAQSWWVFQGLNTKSQKDRWVWS